MSISVSVGSLTQLPQWRLSHLIDFKIFLWQKNAEKLFTYPEIGDSSFWCAL